METHVNIKNLVKKLIGEGNMGRLDFFFRNPADPDMHDFYGGPFNGQKYRRRILFDLLYYFPINTIVETGMHYGTTTALFAATSLPIYAVENNPRYFASSQLRFFRNRNKVHLYKGDSRSFLRNLSHDSSVSKEDVFFYLDAHWGKDLPLEEELEIIFSNWKRPIVMIDDFQVPNSNYGYDNYGPGKALSLSYVGPAITTHNLSVFFPAVNASEETGARAGIAVLCQEMTGIEIDKKINTLVRYKS
jgi:hypothetical protein